MLPIPYDVLMEILPLVHFADLATLARANKTLSAYALDRIYNHIHCRNMKGACEAIASNPTLATRVHTLEITREYHWNRDDIESFLPPLRDALRITLNLRTLILDIDGHHSCLGDSLGVFKLRSFSCSAYTDDDLLKFLNDQSELEELVLKHSAAYARSGPWKFPNLRKLNAPMSWVDTIAPHNPVSDVVVSHIIVNGAISSLGLTSTPIRRLEIPIHAVDRKPFQELKALLPALEELSLVMSHNWGIPMADIPDMPKWLQDLLLHLSNVESLAIICYYPNEPWFNDDAHLVKKATEHAPRIRKISLKHRTSPGIGWRAVDWTRGSNGWERTVV
ncbi:hypothetical protein FB451DRAFT_1176097 [Mycena latifolia]|nr:hypothetical protein FB451DRAFT_1176097 [Mycena latifolia]